MKKFSKACVLGLTLLTAGISSPMKAQSDSVSMDLDKVLEVALSGNADIQVADKTIETKKYAKKESISGLFPTLSVTAAGVKNIVISTMAMSMNGQTIKVHMGQPYNYSLTGTLTLPLVAPQLWKSIQVSQESVELALEESRSSKVSTIANVRKAFYSLLATRESYNVYQTIYALSQENYELTRNMYKQGLKPEIDTLKAYADLIAIEPNLIQLRNTLPVLEKQLKVLMGVDINEPIRFEGDLKDYEAKLFRDLMILKDNSNLEDNSTLKQLDIQKRQLILAEKINKLGYVPTLALQLSAGYSAMPSEFNPFTAPYYGNTSLTLAFSWTFDAGTIFKTKQNNLSIESLDIQRENINKQLELSINSSLTSIETAGEQVVADKAAINAAQRTYDITSRSYELGAATQLEVHAASQSLESSWLQYVQAINDFVTAQAALEETLGRTVAQ